MSHLFNLPALKANPMVKGIPTTSKQLHRSLRALGRTAEQIAPVDWRTKIPISKPLNQQSCGDCWAVSSCGALADRFILVKNIKNIVLNPAYAQCMSGQGISLNASCSGGLPYVAGKYFEQVGIPEDSDSCSTYADMCQSSKCELPTCEELTKSNCYNNTKYKALPGSTNNTVVVEGMNIHSADTITNTKLELHHGPIVSCFFVPVDFYVAGFIKTSDHPNGYKWESTNGVFINGEYNDEIEKLVNQMESENPGLGTKLKKNFNVSSVSDWGNLVEEGGHPAGHAVEVVGWDYFDTGSKYGKIPAWIVKNSWGEKWAENGYFKIAMNSPSENSKNIKFNENLGFDVPITRWRDSAGNLNSLGGIFGGGTKFDPDTSSGREEGYDYNPNTILPFLQLDFSKPNVQYGIGIFIIIILIAYILYTKHKNK